MKLNEQTKLSLERTRFSAERTLMSGIRTSFSMITFGFTLLKFFQYLQRDNPNTLHISGAKHLGISLILLGIASLIPGMIEHHKTLKMLHAEDTQQSRWSYAFVIAIAIAVAVLGLYALANTLDFRL